MLTSEDIYKYLVVYEREFHCESHNVSIIYIGLYLPEFCWIFLPLPPRYLLLNVASHTMDFLPNAQELVCEQLSSEIYTKVLCATHYI